MLPNICLFFALWAAALAIPIDNGVEGDPEIECGPTSITISFNVRNNFEGHVYVKGLFKDDKCRNDKTGGKVASIALPFDTCNVQRTRSLNPRGIFVHTTVIISFHPHFETKVDRAYRIQCFYMEADKTVSTELEVSMLTTGFQTQIVPMPVCRYQILDGGPNGNPVRFAIIGQQVYHKWTCDTETVDTFCMRVHSCFVDDGNGDKVTLLNENGCAQDKYLLRNLEYTTDLMAGQEAHVFKYADRAQLFFQCQIAITIKEPNSQCAHPQCPDLTTGRKRRLARIPDRSQEEAAGTVDVIAQLESFDLQDDKNRLPAQFRHGDPTLLQAYGGERNADFCMSSTGFGFLVAIVVCVFVTTVTSMTILCLRRSKKE